MPQIGPDEVLIKSRAAPIGSDVRVYNSDPVMMRVTHPPVIIGGQSPAAIRRAARLGDGWQPFAQTPEAFAPLVEQFKVEMQVPETKSSELPATFIATAEKKK